MTTAAAPTATPETTEDQIDAAILAALIPTDTELVAWRTIRPQLPGSWWQQTRALTRLFESGAVYAVMIDGRNYVCLERGRNAPGPVLGHPRELRVL